jgi:AAA domain
MDPLREQVSGVAACAICGDRLTPYEAYELAKDVGVALCSPCVRSSDRRRREADRKRRAIDMHEQRLDALLSDVSSEPHDLSKRSGDNGAELAAGILIVTAAEFAAFAEHGADPIVGTADSQLIAEGADVVVYGDGGVGKTTLTIDLGYHLAAGDDWQGIAIPRPVRVLLVENEGPRPLFRRKVARKELSWAGSPTEGRVFVLEEPWAMFSFAHEEHRQLLADKVAELEVDLAIIGPITATGMDAPGTIAEVRSFTHLVDDVRALSGRTTLAIILIHHENRAGKPSGSWEGVCDTLIHVTQQGHGRIRVFFQKAKWASDLHLTKLDLVWAEGDTFARTEAEASRPERTWDSIADYVLAHGGTAWGPVRQTVSGTDGYLQQRRDAMLADGVLINAGGKGGFRLWHRDDPARPPLPESRAEDRTDSAFPHAPPDVEGEGVSCGGAVRKDRTARTDAPATPDPERTGPHNGPHDEGQDG